MSKWHRLEFLMESVSRLYSAAQKSRKAHTVESWERRKKKTKALYAQISATHTVSSTLDLTGKPKSPVSVLILKHFCAQPYSVMLCSH